MCLQLGEQRVGGDYQGRVACPEPFCHVRQRRVVQVLRPAPPARLVQLDLRISHGIVTPGLQRHTESKTARCEHARDAEVFMLHES